MVLVIYRCRLFVKYFCHKIKVFFHIAFSIRRVCLQPIFLPLLLFFKYAVRTHEHFQQAQPHYLTQPKLQSIRNLPLRDITNFPMRNDLSYFFSEFFSTSSPTKKDLVHFFSCSNNSRREICWSGNSFLPHAIDKPISTSIDVFLRRASKRGTIKPVCPTQLATNACRLEMPTSSFFKV